MQFANQAISLFISGIFCLVWIGFLAWPLDDFIIRKTLKNVVFNKEIISVGLIGLTFLLFPLAYAIGSAVNALVNRLFRGIDNKIRCSVITAQLGWRKLSQTIDGLGMELSLTEDEFKKIDCKKNGKSHEEIFDTLYHHYRFKIYHAGTQLYEYLLFHREIIRILRATCFNFFMIYFALLTISQSRELKIIGYSFIVLVLVYILFDLGKLSQKDSLRWLYSDVVRIFILISLILIPMLLELLTHSNYLITFSFLFSIFISLICFIAWKKKQQSFYKTIIRAERVMSDKNANENS